MVVDPNPADLRRPPSGSAELLGVCLPHIDLLHCGRQAGLDTFAEHWDGTSWTIQTTTNPSGGSGSALESVSCTSTSSCTSVGTFIPTSGLYRSAFAMRWDNRSWTIQSTPTPAEARGFVELHGVSCTSTSSCTAVGSYATALFAEVIPTERKTLALFWDGSGWAQQSSPNPTSHRLPWFNAISCSASNACTAVGAAQLSSSSADTVTLGEGWR